MYAIYGDIYHQYTPNVSIYTSTMDPMGYNELVFDHEGEIWRTAQNWTTVQCTQAERLVRPSSYWKQLCL